MNSSGGINNHLGVIGGINIQRNILAEGWEVEIATFTRSH